MSYRSFTDQTGAFHSEAVSPGSYYIMVISTYFPGVADRDAASIITIKAASSAIGELELPPEFPLMSISGSNYGSLQNLIDADLFDENFIGLKAGYHFSIVASGSDYNAAAVPVAIGGRFGIYSTPDAVVRYSLAPVLSPSRESGKPVR